VIEDYFPINGTPSHYSANFDSNDYNTTDIEVILETLFDEDRIHLTEKSLRPIALAQPFILAATAGSLEYLRSYGFKTFSNVWDESYDTIKDPEHRLVTIAGIMKQIDEWDLATRRKKLAEAQDIADYNRQHFFSQAFFNQVVLASVDDVEDMEEGCFSFPGIYVNIKRPNKILARWQNSDGELQEAVFEGYNCKCFLHELDHLEGIVFQDRVSTLKWAMAVKKTKKRNFK
jgi:peptide deformylase